jgi:alpha-L-glutamate ligase-like protein
MVHLSDILGMNARVQLYTSLNAPEAKKYGFSKLRAKAFLHKHDIGVPELYAQITSSEELRHFDWRDIKGSFAIKPASGSAGKGIIVIAQYLKRKNEWVDVAGHHYNADDLNLHVSDILAGQYSTWGTKYKAIIEERVPIHPDLSEYAQLGTPDVRVIVYHNIPVMAMARIPTEASGGRANLDQGAIGLGIDLATGKSTYGVSGKKKVIGYFPHNQRPVGGIQIPNWTQVLKTAVRAANATGLVYMGADIFLHPERGPLIAEVNAYPGLSIQLANHDGLRRRLQRLEGVEARNVSHAVKISQSLFGVSFPGTGADDIDRPIVAPKETVIIYGDRDRKIEVRALLNTGRYRSVIAQSVAQDLGLNDPQDLLWDQRDETEEKVPVVPVTFRMKDRKIDTSMIVSARLNNKRYPVELGRHDLAGFLLSAEET